MHALFSMVLSMRIFMDSILEFIHYLGFRDTIGYIYPNLQPLTLENLWPQYGRRHGPLGRLPLRKGG